MFRLVAAFAALLFVAVSVHAANDPPALDCAGDVGDPVSGSAEWLEADLNNQQCAAEGLHTLIQNNPAVAAAAAANTAAGFGNFFGDPFRAPNRWAGQRGTYQLTSYRDRTGRSWSAALFGPLDLGGGPYPGVLIVCHICPLFPTVEYLSTWYYAAEALAEAGYVVMYATASTNAMAIDATDFFAATPGAPTPRGDFNPWHESLDRSRLGIAGHSGAAGISITVGHSDPRYDVIVAWDPAGSYTMAGVTPRIPTMIQVADYRQESVPPARPEKPIPTLPKFFFFDTISAAGIDTMQVGVRATMHFDWSRFPSDPARPHSIYGETVAMYYTLAWLDRYLAPARFPGFLAADAQIPAVAALRRQLSELVATDALRRLTGHGAGRFDRSADLHSIGVGFFDAGAAERAESPEAGNVPITIGVLPIRNLLSFHYDSRYFLDGGALQCEDMRAGCPSP